MDSSCLFNPEEALASLVVTVETLTVAQRQALDDCGYLVLPPAVDAGELETLPSAFDRACAAEGVPESGTRHPKTLLDCHAAFVDFLIDPGLLAAVLHVLGRPFFVGQIAGRDPLPGYGQQGLHIDCVDPGPATPFQVVTALGLLDAFTPDNGATRLVPGSHRARRPPPKSFADPASRHPEQVVITAPPGSLLVFNGHLWHAGTRNCSRGHRRAVQCSFGRGDRPSGPASPGLSKDQERMTTGY
jgi:Phytanoyl-CoA dioxygenase (PhyH)